MPSPSAYSAYSLDPLLEAVEIPQRAEHRWDTDREALPEAKRANTLAFCLKLELSVQVC